MIWVKKRFLHCGTGNAHRLGCWHRTRQFWRHQQRSAAASHVGIGALRVQCTALASFLYHLASALPHSFPCRVAKFCSTGRSSSRGASWRCCWAVGITVGKAVRMAGLDTARAELALLVLYLGKAETRDKLVRAIQYGAKFVSNGEPGVASGVDKQASLARKVFRLLKYLNEVQGLFAPAPKSTPLPLVLLAKARHALVGTFLALDQIVWAGRVGIYKNKERTDLLSRIALYCWLAGTGSNAIIELAELGRLNAKNKKIDRELKHTSSSVDSDKLKQVRAANVSKVNERTLTLVKNALDILVAAGLLQLAPRTLTPRKTGAFGFITSLITMYQLLPSPQVKGKLA